LEIDYGLHRKTEKFELNANKILFIACDCLLRQDGIQGGLGKPVLILPISSSFIQPPRRTIYEKMLIDF